MVCVPPHSVRLDGEIQGARCLGSPKVRFLTKCTKEMYKKNIKMWRTWSAMRDAGLKFCQNKAVLGRIDLEAMEMHKKALKHQKSLYIGL